MNTGSSSPAWTPVQVVLQSWSICSSKSPSSCSLICNCPHKTIPLEELASPAVRQQARAQKFGLLPTNRWSACCKFSKTHLGSCITLQVPCKKLIFLSMVRNIWVWTQNFRVSKALTSYEISSIINFIDKFAHCFVIVLHFRDAAILWWLRHAWALQPKLAWEGLTKATPFTWNTIAPLYRSLFQYWTCTY